MAIISRGKFHSILEKYPWEKRKFQREMQEMGTLGQVQDGINLEQQAAHCEALKRVPFFAGDSMHAFAAELAMDASPCCYRQGHVIIREGDSPCDRMYVLLSGAVEVSSCGKFLGRLEDDLFGEVCVLDILERRTATVVAAAQCQCLALPRRAVAPLLAKHPEARRRLQELARGRLLALNEALGPDDAPWATPAQRGPCWPLSRGGLAAQAPVPGKTRLSGCAVGLGGFVEGADASLFAASRVFRDARPELLRELSGAMLTEWFEEGATVVEEGQSFPWVHNHAAVQVYWIVKGQAEVWKAGNFVTLLGEGDCFGELAAFAPKETSVRQATVKGKTRLILRTVRAAKLKCLLTDHDDPQLVARWKAEMENNHVM